MSDLAATNCGCGCDNNGGSCGCNCGCGCGGFGNNNCLFLISDSAVLRRMWRRML
ncbi:MAG: hypothetical protein ACLT76_05405 [Clostridium fessum]